MLKVVKSLQKVNQSGQAGISRLIIFTFKVSCLIIIVWAVGAPGKLSSGIDGLLQN